MTLSQKWDNTTSAVSSRVKKLTGFFNSLELAAIKADLKEYRQSILPSYGQGVPQRVQEHYERLTNHRDRLLEKLGLPAALPQHVEHYLKQQI